MLVSMMYNLPGLDWSQPTDHAELFSGGMSVTIGELEASSFLVFWDGLGQPQPITLDYVQAVFTKLG